jgi:hypothetical protein
MTSLLLGLESLFLRMKAEDLCDFSSALREGMLPPLQPHG